MSVMKEAMDDDPRFATQLMSPADAKASKHGNKDEEEEMVTDEGSEIALDEFSACGAGSIAGVSAPFGGKRAKQIK